MTTRQKTRWLDAEEQKAWRAYLESTLMLFNQLEHELQVEAGVPHGYYEILVRLSEAPNRTLRMSELAENSLSSRSRVSHAVARLEELGWIKRQSCATDGRGTQAVLTAKGFSVLENAAPIHVEGVRTHLFDQLSPAQVKQMRSIGESVLQHLKEQD